MFKKFLFVGGGLTLASFLLFGTAAFSHVEHGVSWMRQKVKDSVPVEYELERARELIQKTEPEIRQCKRVIATKQVEIKYLKDDIARREEKQARDKQLLRHKAEQLADAQKVAFRVNRGEVSRRAYEADAARLLDRVKESDVILTSMAQRLVALENGLGAAKVRLEKVRAQRELLTTQVTSIEAKIQEAKAKEAMAIDLDVDDSSLHEAGKILADLNKKLDVELKVIEMDRPLLDDAMPSFDDVADLHDRISNYLDGAPAEAEFEAEGSLSVTLEPTDAR